MSCQRNNCAKRNDWEIGNVLTGTSSSKHHMFQLWYPQQKTFTALVYFISSNYTHKPHGFLLAAKRKPARHRLNDPNLPNGLNIYQNFKIIEAVLQQNIAVLRETSRTGTNSLQTSKMNQKLKRTPQSSRFSRQPTHNGLGNLEGSPKMNTHEKSTNHPEIQKRRAYLSYKHHHLQSEMVHSYSYIARVFQSRVIFEAN